MRILQSALAATNFRSLTSFTDALRGENTDFEVHVGVQGVTGAGKSSLLGALLSYEDLLPSNNAEAATATICKVAYSHEDDPDKAFHARITFRTRKDVKEELDKFFENVKERERLLHPDTAQNEQQGEHDDYADDDAKAKAVEELNDQIQDVAGKIKAVWGFTIDQLATMSSEDLLTPDDPTAKLLSSTKSVYGSEKEAFAAEIKPYLDSTVQELKGKSGAKARVMAVWPLIDHVDIYVKADILKGGLVLVDLPGLSDIVESRAAVARKYYQNLSVTAIVSPYVRAADERTAVNLMTENQELNMRMDGKFDSHSFCVVLSKSDDIDFGAVAKQEGWSNDLKAMADFAEQLERCDRSFQYCKKTAEDLRKTKKAAKDGSEKESIEAKLKKYNRAKKGLLKREKTLKASRRILRGTLVHRSIQARNRVLKKRIS